MKRLPSLPVEFPNMLYIFIMWIKKLKERVFFATIRAGKDFAFFTLGGGSVLQNPHWRGQETAPKQCHVMCKGLPGEVRGSLGYSSLDEKKVTGTSSPQCREPNSASCSK